jgi:hypothetical protein
MDRKIKNANENITVLRLFLQIAVANQFGHINFCSKWKLSVNISNNNNESITHLTS